MRIRLKSCFIKNDKSAINFVETFWMRGSVQYEVYFFFRCFAVKEKQIKQKFRAIGWWRATIFYASNYIAI